MTIESKFEQMGARAVVVNRSPVDQARVQRFRQIFGSEPRGRISLDIRRDKNGEYFLLSKPEDVDLEVLQVAEKDRHLLLMTRDGKEKAKFLCGHDERHWFVAAVPEDTPVSTVQGAKDALKPDEVKGINLGKRAKKMKNRRKTKNWVRQGEWFFVPDPSFSLTTSERGMPVIHKNEPIFRTGGGNPHMCEELVRVGGQDVMIHRELAPNGISREAYNRLDREQRQMGGWRAQTRDMEVWVRGKVSHPDHATVTLNGWHKVIMNTEQRASAMQHVTFVD